MSTNCKFYKEEEYVSYDSGETWTAMGVYRKGDLIEYDSEDCGYVPPTPTGNTKFSATYSGGQTYSAACDGNTTLTTATTRPSGYQYSAMTTAEIGNCVTSIGKYAFSYCSGLTSVTIPSAVTSIGSYAFNDCTSLTSITSLATTPPTLGSTSFNYTNNCPIYVPSGSVNAYKSASGWSDYASRIQAIP